LDGTLVDSGRDLVQAANAARAHLGLPPLDDLTVLGYVGRGGRELMRRALGGAPSEAQVEEALACFREYYAAHLLDHTRPYPGVEEALAAGPAAGRAHEQVTPLHQANPRRPGTRAAFRPHLW
jgi:phosphoglycolate phosphatase